MSGQAGCSSHEHRSRVERLFRDHYEHLVRFLRVRFPVHEAREAAAEAFVRLLSHDSTHVDYWRAFLYRTAANVARDGRRRHEVRSRAQPDIPLLLFSEFIDDRTPERRASADQELQRLQRAIEAMPSKCRMAFVMHQIEGQDFPQIAKEMRLSESSVRKYVERGLLHLEQLDRGTTNAKR